jgi:AraC-like DNA-binding protein
LKRDIFVVFGDFIEGVINIEAKFEYYISNTDFPTSYHKSHQHPCCELVYYLSGAGNSNIGGTDFVFNKNTFSCVPGNIMHNRSYIEDTEFMAIGFLYNLPFEIPGGVYEDIEGKILVYLQQIKEEFQNQKNQFQLRLDTLVIEILIEIDRLVNPVKKPLNINALTYIKNYLDLHYNEKIDFSNLAEMSFYSHDHFRHKFKEFTGYSPNQYLIVKRIESAKEMLQDTNYSVIQIALKCGFSSSAQFDHLFKKYVSQTPLKFRKKHHQGPKNNRVFPKVEINKK